MEKDRKKIKKEKKRLKFIREMRNRRNESKRKYDINYPRFKGNPRSKK